jgi:hypothetical protein
MDRRTQGVVGWLARWTQAPDRVIWTPRPASPARISVIVFQGVAMAMVTVAMLAALWWLSTSTSGAAFGTLLSAILVAPVSAGLLVLGWTGLRRWLAGGPPTRLYGFDALPVIFLLATAGPGALQDFAGFAIAIAFVLPGLVTYLATSG